MALDLAKEYARLHNATLPNANAQVEHIKARAVYEPPEAPTHDGMMTVLGILGLVACGCAALGFWQMVMG